MITYKTGDLFTSTKTALGHGVNCQGVMGSGIAVTVKKLFPENFKAYRNVCQKGLLKPGMVYPYREKNKVILNIASQNKTGADASLDWIAIGMWKALGYCEDRGLDGLAIPRIGSKIGGLDWKDVHPLLKEIFDDWPLELEIWTLPEQVAEDARKAEEEARKNGI